MQRGVTFRRGTGELAEAAIALTQNLSKGWSP